MKCPTVKKKGVCGAELQTRRTLANGRTVRRERLCPVCHAQYWTVELIESDLEKERTASGMQLADLIGQRDAFKIEVENVRSLIGQLWSFAKIDVSALVRAVAGKK